MELPTLTLWAGKMNVVTDSDTKTGIYILNSTASVELAQMIIKWGVYTMTDGTGNADNYGGMFES